MTDYLSTRGGDNGKKFTDVLLDGLAHDGGLYVPSIIPRQDPCFWAELAGQSYPDIAAKIISLFTGQDIPQDVLHRLTRETYAYNESAFRDRDITPLVTLDRSLHILELFHGPTLAFKDIALQLLGRLFDYILEREKKQITIVGATSGDTGSAAIEAVRHCKNARIFILHPHKRTSDIQRRQMTCVQADNVFNIAIEGSFDDCQNIVKDLFNDRDFRKNQSLAAINSINWARIVAQSVYYAHSAIQLGAPGKPVRFAVPTGNFGNIYAAYIIQKMGLPVDRLIIGSNRNDILTRFFETGRMQMTDLHPSNSPSMDIQISSNFERYLFDLFGRDHKRLNFFMDTFKTTGHAAVTQEELHLARNIFAAYRCDDAQTVQTIADIHNKYNYLCDPHTAVGLYAALNHGLDDSVPTISLACAHPAKFPDTVSQAVGKTPPLPAFLSDLMEKQERFRILRPDTDEIRAFINQSN